MKQKIFVTIIRDKNSQEHVSEQPGWSTWREQIQNADANFTGWSRSDERYDRDADLPNYSSFWNETVLKSIFQPKTRI